MFDAAAQVLEEIASEEKTRNEVLGARVNLYMAAKKWDMAAAVASHLVKVDPETAGWWISLAYALRRTEGIEKAKAILLRAQAIHPEVAMIAFNLACYASVAGHMEEAKEQLQHAIKLDKYIRGLALDDEDLRSLWDWILLWRESYRRRRLAMIPQLEEVTNRLLQITREFKTQLSIYNAAIRHPRTPRLARWLLVAAIAYLASPIDLIPDFIPVLGHLDDLIIIPALVALAVRLIPQDVLAECRKVH